MPRPLSDTCQNLLARQRGVLTRTQAIESGVDPATVARRAGAGQWQRLYPGVYAVFTGEPGRESLLWAAVLRAGAGAVCSHQTAAELWRLADEPSSVIQLTIPADRHIARIPGVVLHRSHRLDRSAHPAMLPPRTRIEHTVLDLAGQAAHPDTVFGWAAAACQRRLTTPTRLLATMASYPKLRWRAELTGALASIADEAHSLLERGYVRLERAHGLPAAARQAKFSLGGRTAYLDNLYEAFLVGVELDGSAAHPADKRWRDISRDNAAAVSGLQLLRYGWTEVMHRPCAVASQLGSVLRRRGWDGAPRRCSPGCPAVPAGR
jgi:Transcriptional regulator, AbiEi antitoxin